MRAKGARQKILTIYDLCPKIKYGSTTRLKNTIIHNLKGALTHKNEKNIIFLLNRSVERGGWLESYKEMNK